MLHGKTVGNRNLSRVSSLRAWLSIHHTSKALFSGSIGGGLAESIGCVGTSGRNDPDLSYPSASVPSSDGTCLIPPAVFVTSGFEFSEYSPSFSLICWLLLPLLRLLPPVEPASPASSTIGNVVPALP